MPAVKNIVLNVFRTVCNFVYAYILKDPTIQTENYIPGHGMLMVDRQGNPQHILLKIEQKFKYQLAPYLVDMEMAGILTCNRNDLDNLLQQPGFYIPLHITDCPTDNLHLYVQCHLK